MLVGTTIVQVSGSYRTSGLRTKFSIQRLGKTCGSVCARLQL
jgi:hypothetical protein